ncbi:oxidoreductase [Salinisphaera sp. PC39]|uniref:NAD(P)/FAD-dependent oxidoreductase n=1 Tax=Salinisphaera sp. PC39 TaxID=1304156 RepID=UPI00333F9034
MTQSPDDRHHRVVVVGGGAAGIGFSAALRRRAPDLDIALIEPSDRHWYQPAFTLVGGGCYPLERTVRDQADLIPPGVTWIRAAAESFDADSRAVILADGRRVGYDRLVLCPGLQLDWDAVEGLPETLGRNGVASNYDPATAAYTWDCLRDLRHGRALFTQAPMPIKCPGAPQKIAYLAADHLRRVGRRHAVDIEFATAGEALFSVPAFVAPLQAVAERHGIGLRYRKNLIAVDGERGRARFRVADDAGGTREVEEAFDFLHVTPPQSAPDVIKRSPFANEAGWVDVDPRTLRHPRYPEVFGLGDAGSTPNSKTAAAVRSQIPVVRDNLLAGLDGDDAPAAYDGYGACPVTTARGRVLLAEFRYGGEVTPSFPLDPTRERRSMWHFKKDFLPWFYWNWLLKGRTWDIGHRPY